MTKCVYLTAVVFALLTLSQAQTLSLNAPTGSVNPQTVGTLNFSGGGNASVAANLSPCYFNNNPASPCYFSAGEVSYYNMPHHSPATLTTFTGRLQPHGGNVYTVTGAASGFDTSGNKVSVSNVQFTFTVFCRSGRGGGCSKTHHTGSMTFTLTP